MNTLRDTWIIYVRQMRPTMYNPTVVLFGMLQPVLYLALFAPLLSGMPGAMGESPWEWFVPGVLAMLGIFTTAFAGFGLLPEIRSGSYERLLATPVSRTALLAGRVLRDITVLLGQALIIMVVMVPLGLRPSPVGLVLGLVLLAVLGLGLGTLSYLGAMALKLEYAFATLVQTITMPLILLSGVMLPMDLAPTWLYALSRANPVSHVVDAERALFAGDFTDPSVAIGAAVAVVLAAVALALGIRAMRRLSV
ncbi:ABC transporter permease [Nocardiopsis sediminis]|uniref:Transport permease protein n=1 Tax=Nocardiopsis sediminis TaxID=1778267 RepID=A0ABV8FHS4_9ACTN